jgi:protein-S-isoprenylcysteine O-methyltransferase Ste14
MVTGRVANFVLFAVTAVELGLLFYLVPSFSAVDWVYLAQHLLVLGIAVTRHSPKAQDLSLASTFAVAVSYAYPYAQVALLKLREGDELWPDVGEVLVIIAAVLSLSSLLTLGRAFGVRPALRRLATKGPYRLVRHPIYFAYIIADVGYNSIEWTPGTVLLTLVGWASLVYRIRAEERILSQDAAWTDYSTSVRYRLIPWLW